MTWRGALLVAATIALIAADAAQPLLYPAGAALLALALLAIVVDSLRAASHQRVEARRYHESILSVGVANTITLAVSAGRRAEVVLRDECPASAYPSQERWDTMLPVHLQYTVTPRRRGLVRFGHTVVRVQGPWRIGWRQVTAGMAEDVPVEAGISSVRVYEALARRGQLAELGVRTLRLRTEGTEFDRIREAVPDDPLRSVNWKATARTGRLMATELMPERAQPVIICLDHGRLMGARAGELSKLDYAVDATVLLTYVALRSGDRAGFLGFTDTVTATVEAHSGAAQLRRVLDSIRTLKAEEMEADHDAALEYLSRWQRRRALVVIFTDIIDPDQGTALLRQCVRLRRRHLPVVVTVRDPVLEDQAAQDPHTPREAYARAIAGSLIADRDGVVNLLRRSGVDAIDADVRSLSPRVVNRYLALKRQARL